MHSAVSKVVYSMYFKRLLQKEGPFMTTGINQSFSKKLSLFKADI